MYCKSLDFFFQKVWDGKKFILFDSDGYEIREYESWVDVNEDLMGLEVLFAEVVEDFITEYPYWEIMLSC